MSENPTLTRFEPHVSGTAEETEPLVWAVDTRHLPLYWFPRDCPRGTFWADSTTDPADAERLVGGASRVHIVEEGWLERIRTTTVFAYRLADATFEPHPEVGGYWISRMPAEPLAFEPLGDLGELHAQSAIELRALPNLWPLWDEVVGSSLQFSGMRLRNADPGP